MNKAETPEHKMTYAGDPDSLAETLDMSQFTSGNIFFEGDEELKSVTHTYAGTIEVIVIRHRQITQWPRQPEIAIKKIYKAKGGQIYLADEIKGEVIPEKTIPQRIEWDS